jgi:hypothetical protein
MEPSPRASAGRIGDAQCLAASVSESGHEGLRVRAQPESDHKGTGAVKSLEGAGWLTVSKPQ